MLAANKFLHYVLHVVILYACSGIACSQNLQVSDSVNMPPEFSSNAGKTKTGNQKPSNNFYKTDSVFSFCSQKGYVPSLLHNIGEQATAPLHFGTRQWLITAAALGTTVVLIHFDGEVDEGARNLKQNYRWINKSSPVITEFGGNYSVYTVGAIGLVSAAFNNQKGVQTSLLASQAMITSGIWIQLIKQIAGRERPMAAYTNSMLEGGKWHGPFAGYTQGFSRRKPKSFYDAFASGHTATAFSVATVFASQYNDTWVVPVFSYSLATLVGISRLTEHEHWSSDVFVGALIGYLCGKQVVAHFNKTHQNNITSMSSILKSKTELSFIQDENQVGLCLKW
jgi:hypothetical protein